MMEWALQAAIYARLSGDIELDGLGVSIHDAAPQVAAGDPAAPFPRVEIGYLDAREWDTKTENGLDVILRIHSFSASGSMKEAREIQGRIYELLHRQHAALALDPAYSLTLLRRDSSDLDRDPDKIFHGVCEYRALIETL